MTQDQVIGVLVWALIIIGGALGSIIAWLASSVMTEVKDIKKLLADELKELREDHIDLDKRVVRIETHCVAFHRFDDTGNHSLRDLKED